MYNICIYVEGIKSIKNYCDLWVCRVWHYPLRIKIRFLNAMIY